LDFGAIDHMTPHSYLLTSYVSLFDNHMVVDIGTHIPINGSGNVSILPSLSLKDFHYVSKLSYNLIFS